MNQIISLSGGKDSTAMMHMMIENNESIHSIVFFDTGWEFPAMYDHLNLIEQKTELKISGTAGKLPNKSLRDGEGEFGIDDLFKRTKEYIINYNNNLFNGNFRHTKYPNDIQCSNYCTYKMVCRKDIGKINSMNEQEL